MKIQYPILATALMALLLPGLPAKAGEKGPDFGFNASAGYQYDSNVNVAELDTNTGEADGALLLSAGVNAALPLTKNLSFNVGYDYSQTSYREFPAFDVAMHHGLAEFAYDVAGFNTALTFDRFDVRLDGDSERMTHFGHRQMRASVDSRRAGKDFDGAEIANPNHVKLAVS
jgi:hypothetical protein